jgi:hypothetical protein
MKKISAVVLAFIFMGMSAEKFDAKSVAESVDMAIFYYANPDFMLTIRQKREKKPALAYIDRLIPAGMVVESFDKAVFRRSNYGQAGNYGFTRTDMLKLEFVIQDAGAPDASLKMPFTPEKIVEQFQETEYFRGSLVIVKTVFRYPADDRRVTATWDANAGNLIVYCVLKDIKPFEPTTEEEEIFHKYRIQFVAKNNEDGKDNADQGKK